MFTGYVYRPKPSTPLASADLPDRLNPYSPPAVACEPIRPALPPENWHLLKIRVVEARKYAMRRCIVLAGDINAEVRYDGWAPSELVTVNGRKRFRGSLIFFTIVCPVIPFELETTSHWVPAFIEAEARLSWGTLFRLDRFQITVAGQLVYADEGA